MGIETNPGKAIQYALYMKSMFLYLCIYVSIFKEEECFENNSNVNVNVYFFTNCYNII